MSCRWSSRHGRRADDVDVILTVEAAEETSERLLSESFKARGQRRLKRYRHRPQDD